MVGAVEDSTKEDIFEVVQPEFSWGSANDERCNAKNA